jgi:hypothetical protein
VTRKKRLLSLFYLEGFYDATQICLTTLTVASSCDDDAAHFVNRSRPRAAERLGSPGRRDEQDHINDIGCAGSGATASSAPRWTALRRWLCTDCNGGNLLPYSITRIE